MLRYVRDGKYVDCPGIDDRGHLGQIVIHAGVAYEENPDPTKYPLAKYQQPYVFAILEINIESCYYVLEDADGNTVIVNFDNCEFLFSAKDWLAWHQGRHEYEIHCLKLQIETLTIQLALLKDILTTQGVRIVSDSKAKELGIS